MYLRIALNAAHRPVVGGWSGWVEVGRVFRNGARLTHTRFTMLEGLQGTADYEEVLDLARA